MAAAGFLSRYLSGHLPYNRKLKNVLSASLNKTFPSLYSCRFHSVFCCNLSLPRSNVKISGILLSLFTKMQMKLFR